MSSDLLCDPDSFACKVSSVLNRNVKEFGKKFLFDGREDTCWNSEQGKPQFIHIQFNDGQKRHLSELQIMFQGGFAGKSIKIINEDNCEVIFYPEDNNKLQKFQLKDLFSGNKFKIVFEDSTDFFGRITVYKLCLISK